MSDEYSLSNINSLLLQFAHQTRELSQRKNEIDQQIKIYRSYTAEKKSFIETLNINTKKLKEEISVKESIVMKNKVNAKSMKAATCLLLQYEQTLKEELMSIKTSYNQDLELYEERISSCRKTFQSHKDYCYQHPLAQKLLLLQAEKEEIERRVTTCDDQIKRTQNELDSLTGPATNSVSTEQLPDSVIGQQPIIEEEETPAECQIEEDSGYLIMSAFHLSKTADGHDATLEANTEEICEENQTHAPSTCSPQKPRKELWSFRKCDGQSQPGEMHTEVQDQEAFQEHQEQMPTVSDVEDMESSMQEKEAIEDEQTSEDDETHRVTVFPQASSQQANRQSFPEKLTTVPSTPSFAFNFSPGSSPHRGISDDKSPAFLFSLNSDPSTPGFSGFGFDVGSSQDEDSSFNFTGSFFSEKKATGKQPSSCSEFLFGQPEQSKDFQFAAKSPQSARKENSKEEFPFSFNF